MKPKDWNKGEECPLEEHLHPQAQRTVQLGDVLVGYLHKTTRTTRLRLVITVLGLEVRAPRNATIAQIERMIHAHAQWVLDRLRIPKNPVQPPLSAEHAWQDGDVLPFLGAMYRIHVPAVEERSVLSLHPIAEEGKVVEIELGNVTPLRGMAMRSMANVHGLLQSWLMQQAMELGKERLDHYAPMLGVQWTQLRLGNARTRFGSARRDGRIRLNWRLIHFPMAFVDYVVVHELAHLRHMHHGPQFWALIESVLADYRQRRAIARQMPGITLGGPAVRRPPPCSQGGAKQSLGAR
ncbi:M48 family metallopeptidase [Candidatus Symbiobacter mobilis]|uniref:Hydrolase-like protein n=1 Tax=Candidatus Symbiobacter mobilis CR TaxID=946483 RepID=U5N8E2_9BURK|nr:SprT family zinc-dependent metalloprotease [Candidatus Symbiobacter mobilis]AGX86533.1 hydrolase-like protein [Candidatus Symbiobacter mobilis CR]